MGGCEMCGESNSQDSDLNQQLISNTERRQKNLLYIPAQYRLNDNHLFLLIVVNGYFRELVNSIPRRQSKIFGAFPTHLSPLVCIFFPISILKIADRGSCVKLLALSATNERRRTPKTDEELAAEEMFNANELVVDTSFLVENVEYYNSLFQRGTADSPLNLDVVCKLFPYHPTIVILIPKTYALNFGGILKELRVLEYQYKLELRYASDLSTNKLFREQTTKSITKTLSKYQSQGWMAALNFGGKQTSILFRFGYFTMSQLGDFLMHKMSVNTVDKLWKNLNFSSSQTEITENEMDKVLLFCGILLFAFNSKKTTTRKMDKRAMKKSLIPVTRWLVENRLYRELNSSLQKVEFHKLGRWLKDYYNRDRPV